MENIAIILEKNVRFLLLNNKIMTKSLRVKQKMQKNKFIHHEKIFFGSKEIDLTKIIGQKIIWKNQIIT